MLDKIKTNWRILQKQLETFKEAAAIDIARGEKEWEQGDRTSAIHSFTQGPRGEFYQHAWRWIMYRDTLLGVIAVWLFAEWLGWVDLITLTL